MTLIVVLALLLAVLPLAPAWGTSPAAQAKSAIFLIGDGMGINHVRMAEFYANEVLGKELAISSITNWAVTTTHSANYLITDSAAAGSALHSGLKFNNGNINVLPNGTNAHTIGQAAHENGLAVGVVSTGRITHATPASVYGHVYNRDDENILAEQLVEFMPEVVLGGGLRYFLPTSASGSSREDERDLVAELAGAGYATVVNSTELGSLDLASTNHLFGLFTQSHMSYEIDRVANERTEPSIADMTAAAIAVLEQDPDGFFLMVEGGRIDHAAHNHDPAGVLWDILAFDQAIAVALEYQQANPDVLVVITSDHETGGLSIGRGTGHSANISILEPISCSWEYMANRLEPGNALEVAAACNVPLADEDKAMLVDFDPDVEGVEAYGASSLAHWIITECESRLANLGWTTWSHTDQPVITYAVGPGAEVFTGVLDNTDVPRKIAEFLGVEL